MYYKGGSMLHAIRTIINDDDKWRSILRGINATFGRKPTTGRQVRDYISRTAGIDFSKVFEQYLETTKIPVLEYRVNNGELSYRWTNVVRGFDMPVEVGTGPGGWTRIRPTEAWQTVTSPVATAEALKLNPDFFVTIKVAQ